MWWSPVEVREISCISIQIVWKTRDQGLPKSGFSSVGKLNFRDIFAGKKRTSLFTKHTSMLTHSAMQCQVASKALGQWTKQKTTTTKKVHDRTQWDLNRIQSQTARTEEWVGPGGVGRAGPRDSGGSPIFMPQRKKTTQQSQKTVGSACTRPPEETTGIVRHMKYCTAIQDPHADRSMHQEPRTENRGPRTRLQETENSQGQ